MRQPLIVLAALALVCAGCGATRVQSAVPVMAVPSGDTIRLRDGRIVRLYGIDSPSGRECHAYLSRLTLAALVTPGTRVRLLTLSTGRVVVFRGDLNVNLELVRRGAASPYFAAASNLLRQELLSAARRAQGARRGAWGGCYSALDPRRPWRLERRAPDRIFR
jgi:endonuclease YncB( thermonuclease family)